MYKAVCKNFWLSWCDLDDGFLTTYTICVIAASVMQLGVVWPQLIRSDASRSLAVMGFAGWCKPSSRSVAACRVEIYSNMVPTTWPFGWKTIATCKLVLALCWWWAALNEECLINSYTLKATWFVFFVARRLVSELAAMHLEGWNTKAEFGKKWSSITSIAHLCEAKARL